MTFAIGKSLLPTLKVWYTHNSPDCELSQSGGNKFSVSQWDFPRQFNVKIMPDDYQLCDFPALKALCNRSISE